MSRENANRHYILLTRAKATRLTRSTAIPLLLAAFSGTIAHAADKKPTALPNLTSATTVEATVSATALAASLEANDTRIGRIIIRNDNVFDPADPRENNWLYRTANKLHIRTQPDVIASQLLFEEGDLFSVHATDESERILRENRYIREAEITPVQIQDGTVDVEVRTKDVWSLNPSISFGRSGGSNSGGIGLKEYNLLGRGSYVGASYKSNVDRSSTTLQFSNDHFLQSRYQFLTSYGNNSDGSSAQLSLVRPFYALDTRHAGGFSLQSNDQIDSLYNLGSIVADFMQSSEHHEAFIGWSDGLNDNWVKRYTAGVAYERDDFLPNPDSDYLASPIPENRKFLYPFIGAEWIEDRYEEAENYDQINRTEDRYVGRRFGMRIGYASAAAGSSSDAWLFAGSFDHGLIVGKTQSLLLDGVFGGRLESGTAVNALLDLNVRYYFRQSDKSLSFAKISGTLGHNLDIDNPVYLGGDTGLRGYPLRYQSGDKKLLLTVEQRIFTDWYPFRLFHVGGAVFFDAGRTWGTSAVDSVNLGLLKDAGFGLRIGNSRSGQGRVVHIDLAFPLDGQSDISRVQLLVEAKSSF